MVDKQFCMSSYLAFRYVERKDTNFYEGLQTFTIPEPDSSRFIHVRTALEIDSELQKVFDTLKCVQLGLNCQHYHKKLYHIPPPSPIANSPKLTDICVIQKNHYLCRAW
jgi:hypothetical protein